MWLWKQLFKAPGAVCGLFIMALALEGLIFAQIIGPWVSANYTFDATQTLQFTAAVMILAFIAAYWIAKVALRSFFPNLK
jgi:hypothetical protein